MANSSQLEILKQGVGSWNEWRQKNPETVIDLTQSDFKESDLAGVNLAGANLDGSDFTHANLERANFAGANLINACFFETILIKANLSDVIVDNSFFDGANLQESNLTKLVAYYALPSFIGVNLQRAILVDVDLGYVDMSGADLSESKILSSKFQWTNFTNANFNRAIIQKSDFAGAKLDLSAFDEVKTLNEIIYYEYGIGGGWQGTNEDASFPRSHKKQKEQFSKFKLSIAYPQFLSKRYESLFLLQIYLPEVREQVLVKIKRQFGRRKTEEHDENSKLEKRQEVRLRISSPVIYFSGDVLKKLDHEINVTNFLLKPTDECEPGEHQVLLSILDKELGVELESIPFTVIVRDFAFDHVSRPLLSKASSFIFGVGSLVMFSLTLMGRIDAAFGVTSGTTAGFLMGVILWDFFRQYRYPSTVHTP
jgi:hypothetical protein